jgi:hypothetical protein
MTGKPPPRVEPVEALQRRVADGVARHSCRTAAKSLRAEARGVGTLIPTGDGTASGGFLASSGRILAAIRRIFAVCTIGGLLGFLLTYLATEHGAGFGVVAAGPWTFRPQIGTTEIDPYARAMLARFGELPLGTAEGQSFFAHSDSSGAPLDAGCDYRVTGDMPRARYWTLSLQSPDGGLVANPADRYGYTSAEILRSAAGGFEIVVARQARAGNWLPIGSDSTFILMLRLYDAENDMRSAPPDAAEMPRIERVRCR